MIPKSLRDSQRALSLHTRRTYGPPLSREEEQELAHLDAQAEKQVRECIKTHERESRALQDHQKRTRGLNIGTYGAQAA